MSDQNNQLDNLISHFNNSNPHSSQDSGNHSLEEIPSNMFSHFDKQRGEEEKETLSPPVSKKPVQKHVESLKKKLQRIKNTEKKEVESGIKLFFNCKTSRQKYQTFLKEESLPSCHTAWI